MKIGKLTFRIGAVVLALTIGATVIWWRHQAKLKKYPWLDPENHTRIMAEARVLGEAIEIQGSDGNTYYVMGSSKYGVLIKPEEIDWRLLWRHNRDWKFGLKGSEPYGRWSKAQIYTKTVPEGDLKVVPVEPGTTVEELMAEEAE